MGDLFLTIYVCTYVHTWYVHTYRNMSHSGMLRVSYRPPVSYRCGFPTDQLRFICKREQLSSYMWSQTVDICLYRNSTIISCSQRLGYKRAGPSGLAELEQLHVESNSECNRHVYLSSTLATCKHVARLRMRPRRACKAIMRIRIP